MNIGLWEIKMSEENPGSGFHFKDSNVTKSNIIFNLKKKDIRHFDPQFLKIRLKLIF